MLAAADAQPPHSWPRGPACAMSSAEDPDEPDWGTMLSDGALSLSGRSLRSISLRSAPGELREVSLAANSLASIDLGPLARCPALESLVLNGNALTAIDLAPLAECGALEKLWLHNNALRTVDLAPLAGCARLRSLYLEGNKIDAQSVDLGPLRECGMLRSLRLGRNQLGGELDITGLLSCAALSSLDVSPSVRLIACIRAESLSAHAATNSLPPALRRKAATVEWKTVAEEEDAGYEADDYSSDGDISDPDSAVWDTVLKPTAPGAHPCDQTPPVARRQKSAGPLDDLKALASARRTPGTYNALMLGFRGSSRTSIESVLAEHASLTTIAVSTSSDQVSPSSLVETGALRTCHVLLVRPNTESLVLGIRAYDSTMPIIVIGHPGNTPEAASQCLRKGATAFLPEPLSTRDALVVKMHAQRRARSSSPLARKRYPSKDAPELEHRSSSSDGSHDSQDLRMPTSPITSSESSPPSGVPTTPFENEITEEALFKACQSNQCKPVIKAQVPVSPEPASRPVKRHVEVPKTCPVAVPKAPVSMRSTRATIDFKRLRKQERSSSVRGRIEDSGLNMVFSRCGGQARRETFHAIANMCGLPLCTGPLLFDATQAWTAKCEAEGLEDPVPARQLFSLTRRSSSPSINAPAENRSVSPRRSVSSSSLDPHLVVTYEQFARFWRDVLRAHSSEQRLFKIATVAHRFSAAVPREAVAGVVSQFMMRRESGSDKYASSGAPAPDAAAGLLAAQVIVYELQLSSRTRGRISKGDVARAGLCASLLAAESGIYNGITMQLRTDRLRNITAAFREACGERATEADAALSVKDLVWFSAERGMLTPRAVQAAFARHVCGPAMGVHDFGPLWLASNKPETDAATAYFFDILDADGDGYLSAGDCAHFYSEKCALLRREGYVPISFQCIWRSVLDNMCGGRSTCCRGQGRVSLPELKRMASRDRLTLFQSLLFMDDDMASVDVYRTAIEGGDAAAKAARESF